MANEYVVGIDLGTTGLKLLMIGSDGNIRASAFKSYSLFHPKPAWAEQDPREWTRAALEGTRELVAKAGVSNESVVAIGIGSQIDGAVPISEHGEPLGNGIIWMDRRAKQQCEQIRNIISDEELYAITGLSNDASHMAPKIMWIRDNQPDLYKKTKRFLLPGNYLLNYLTGEVYSDHSNASCSMLYDVKKGEWSEKLCGQLEIATELLPAIRDSTYVAGSIDSGFAKSCGLSTDVKVVVGGGDEEVGAVGSGVIDNKALLDLTGTSEPMCLSLDEPILDPTRLLECHAHGYNGKWLLENTGSLSGGIYRWFRDQFGIAEAQQAERLGIEPYEVLDREISSIPPGCEGLLFLPFFSGAILPEWNPDARGVLIGLALGHTRLHFARSIMEGCAYVLRDAVEHLSKIGLSPTRVVLAGGGARALVWRQIKTDIINRHTVRCDSEVTALGAAILAAVGGGLYKDVGAAVEKIVSVGDELSPAPEPVAVYEKLYGMYRESYASLKHVFTAISSFQEH